MNKLQRMFLRILGVLLISIGLLISIYFHFNLDIKGAILTADYVCTSSIGEFAQQVLQKQVECKQISFFAMLINYNWIFYVLGIILFFISIWSSLGAIKKK